MYKLLIVDDEEIIRKGLVKSFDWKSIGIDEVFEAKDGLCAVEIIKEHNPQILITDIRMPNMDGLQLCEYCNTNRINIKILILSGYDDFSYAQRALKIGVNDFLLKPTRIKEIASSVEKMMQKLTNDNKITNQLFHTFLNNLINKRISTPTAYPEFNHVKFKDSDMQILVFKPNSKEALDWNEITDHSMIKYGIINILEELFDKNYLEIFEDTMGNIVSLLYLKYIDQKNISSHIEAIKIEAEQSIGIHISMGIGCVCDKFENLYISYKEALTNAFNYVKLEDNTYLPIPIVYAKKYIEEHLLDDISLNTVADYVHMSPNYFSSFFRREMGENFSSYIANARLEKAKKLLLNRDIKVYEIAEMVGYDNPRYFSEFFKKHTGMTAKEYQSQYFKK